MSLFFPIIDEQPCAAQFGFPFQPYAEPKRQPKRQNISFVANPPSQVNTAEDDENYYILLRKQKLQHPLLKFNNGFDSYEIKYLRDNKTVTIAISSSADKYKKSYEFDADAVDETKVSWELVEPQAMLIKIPKVVNNQARELEELRAEIKRQRSLLVSQRKEFEKQLALEKQKTAQLERKLQQISQQQAYVERQAQKSFQEAAEVQRQLMKQLNEARQQVQQQQQKQQQQKPKVLESKESKESRVNALDALDAAFSKFFESKNKDQNVVNVTIHTAEVEDPPVSSLTDEVSSADESGPGTPDSSDNEDESMSDDKEYVVLKKPEQPKKEQPKKRTRTPSLEDMEDEEFSAFSD